MYVTDYEVFKLLMEVVHTGLYTKTRWDGPLLPYYELIGLIGMSYRYDFRECMKACCEEVKWSLHDDDWRRAVQIIESFHPLNFPPRLIIDLTDEAIRALGPLEGFWGQGDFYHHQHNAVKGADLTKIKVSTMYTYMDT